MAFDPNPKSSKKKYAFTGTNSSGKTTMALDITARLKYAHVLAEVVSSQDRKITWKDDHFPVDPRAHYGMICNLINAEVQAELKGDATCVVTDRSVLDLYAIASYDHRNHRMIENMKPMIVEWLSTYTRIYYLEPLAYQEDGKRPSDDFRMATHGRLIELFAELNPPNLVRMPRDMIFKDIKADLGVVEAKPIFLEAEKWQALANLSQRSLYVRSQRSPISSDLDCWVLTKDPNPPLHASQIETLNHVAEAYFGDHVKVRFMQAPYPESTKYRANLENDGHVYNPQ